jgi:hypothetical protein
MNNFTQHGITHLSASSINAYAEDPAYWVGKYLLGAKFPFSAPARGGTLIERAIVQTLTGRDQTDAIDDAIAEFNKMTVFDKSDNVAKWANAMHDMATAGIKELEQYGIPEFDALSGGQKKILIDCNMGEYKVPIIGFLDLMFPEHKLIVDIKCTFRINQEMSASHRRQAALYLLANPDYTVKFMYISPKKIQWFTIDDVTEEKTQIKEIIKRMNNMLGVGDKDVIKELIPVTESYYWQGAENIRKELYNL